MELLECVLKFLGFREEREVILEEREESGCECCEGYLLDGYECICKEDQVVDFKDGTEPVRWRSRGECSNWDCSYCH